MRWATSDVAVVPYRRKDRGLDATIRVSNSSFWDHQNCGMMRYGAILDSHTIPMKNFQSVPALIY